MFIQCGLNNSVQRFYWDDKINPKEKPILVSSAFSIQFFIGVLVLIISSCSLLLLSNFYSIQQLLFSWVSLGAAIVLMVFKIWFVYVLDITRLQLAPYRFLIISLASRVSSSILGCLVVVIIGWGLDGFLFVQAAVMVVIFPFACFLIRKDLTLKIKKDWCIETFKYGYPFIFAGIAFWLLGTIDRWMLTAFTSLEEVSIYSVAFRFSSIILFITTAFGMAWGPISIKIKSDNPSRYKKLYADLLELFLYAILIVSGVVGLFSGEIIDLLMNKEYSKSALALVLLSFGVGLYGTQQITAIGISIEKKTSLFSHVAWVSLILNIILNYFLIIPYGSVGASFATLISYLFITCTYLYFSEKLHKIPFNKSRLLSLVFMGFFVLLMGLYFCSHHFSIKLILIKLSIILGFSFLGYRVLKINPNFSFKLHR